MTAGELTIEQAQGDQRLRLELHGELDIATVGLVRTTLSEAQRNGQAIEMDTTDVRFIDSTGLATLIATRQRMGERFLLVPGASTRRLLELSGALEHFGLL